MSIMTTLHEIAINYANQQLGMIDTVTEDAPVLQRCKFIPSTHDYWNVAEKMSDISGPAFIESDGKLPYMSMNTELVHTTLHTLGGAIEVGSEKAKMFGGVEKYFASKQDALLKKSGMDLEKQFVIDNWLAAAKANKNLKNAGGTGKGWFILAVRFDDLSNVGLFNPNQFESGRFFTITPGYGGEEHVLHGPGYAGVHGYSVIYRATLGWQILDPKRTCAAIVNIDETHSPTAAQIDDAIADVRGTPSNTILICSPRGRIHGLNPHKKEYIMMSNADKDINTAIESWSGIPIIMSHNFNEKVDKITVS